MYVPRAMYSLRISFCTVPDSERATCTIFRHHDGTSQQRGRGRVDRHARRHLVDAAGPPAGGACRHSVVATLTRPTSPSARRVRVDALCVGRSNATTILSDQLRAAAERSFGRARGAESAYCAWSQTATIHGRLTPRGERKLTGSPRSRRIRRANLRPYHGGNRNARTAKGARSFAGRKSWLKIAAASPREEPLHMFLRCQPFAFPSGTRSESTTAAPGGRNVGGSHYTALRDAWRRTCSPAGTRSPYRLPPCYRVERCAWCSSRGLRRGCA